MIAGVGIDIIEISRIREALKRDGFRKRLFTEREQNYCDSRGAGRAASYAARFAAKEAAVKALGTGFTGGTWQDIEVVSDEAGKPQLILSGYYKDVAENKGITGLHISLTHAREYAAAQVVATRGERNEDCHCG